MVRAQKNLHQLELNGRDVPVCLRRNPSARRLILRVEAGRRPDDPDKVAVTLPRGASDREALAFVSSKIDWIMKKLAALPDRVGLADGTLIPFLGVEHRIYHHPGARRGVWREEGSLHVSGQPEHLTRRLLDWIKREARIQISERVAEKAARIERKAGRISIRDTRSRWGSCAANGNLSFSWRLILAPEYVFDYVIAHEVSHLVEHNHGANFWRVVATLTPEMEQAKYWLRKNGETLHRYG